MEQDKKSEFFCVHLLGTLSMEELDFLFSKIFKYSQLQKITAVIHEYDDVDDDDDNNQS